MFHKNTKPLAFTPVGRKRRTEDMEMKRRHWKGGRPAKIIKRNRVIGVRMNDQEYYIVKHKSGKAGISLCRYLRETGINGEVKMRMSEEDRHIVTQLIGMSNNINQLAKLAHKGGMLTALLLFESYRNQLDQLLNTVKNDK